MPSLLKPIRGIVPPLVTPLKSRDELDLVGLDRLIEYQLDAGVAGLFMLGTTGESPSLSYRMRYEVVERTCELVGGRVPVLIGITDTSLDEAVELSKYAKAVGAAAVVAAAPYYFSIGQTEARDFLTELSDESALPLFVYNIPPCVDLSLEFETFEQLASHENICGLKDSAGDIVSFRKLLQLRSRRPDWTILMGYESLLAEAVLLGADGGVTGGANMFPKLFVDSFLAAERRDQREIDRLQVDIVRLGQVYTMVGTGASGYLRGLKCALESLELCSGEVAIPFRTVEEPERSKIAEFMKSFDLARMNQSVTKN